MKPTPAVRARGITKTFGDVIALDGVDLDVPAGQVHGLVGPNGAGKTTLLGLVLGLAVADAGALEILGTQVGRRGPRSGRPDRIGRALAVPDGVGGFVDGPGLYPSLTARQNLRALLALRGRDTSAATNVDQTPNVHQAQDVDQALDEVGLTDLADDKVRGFSLGMRQRLGLAAALITRPRVLVLDEPANGLDPAGKHHVHRVIRRLADDGVAILLSSHRMDDLAALSSEVTLLATGRVVFSGPIEKLAAERGDLDYRLLTSDPPRAREVAAATPGLSVVADGPQQQTEPLVVRGAVPALDDLVVRLVGAGIALREFAPVVSPLEAAFLALTGIDPALATAGEELQ